ncbi:MAG: hypothetical protein JWM09_298 [Francisellaceae bacterium]|nr:hypothetical protein [Francisellaceae bacterium]
MPVIEKTKLLEKHLGLAVQAWLTLEDWDCFPEAQLRNRGPRADLIAVKYPYVWVIETKLSMSLQVIEQAIRWKTIGAIFTSIAVIKPRRKRHQKSCWYSEFIDRLLRQEGIGLLLIDKWDLSVIEAIEPKLNRYNYQRSLNILNNLHEQMKNYIPGSTAKEGYSTPAKRALNDSLNYIKKMRFCSIDELLINVKTHYRIRSKARKFLLHILEAHPLIQIHQSGFKIHFSYKTAE